MRASLLIAVGTVLLVRPVDAQIFAPGPLAEAHSELEGIGQCTLCHTIGERGVSPDRCLRCHVPLANRIKAGKGYHGSLPDSECATCHKDHLGRDFDLSRLSVSDFVHDETGFELVDSHASVECRACHTREFITDPTVITFAADPEALARTYLGLGTECRTCHQEVDPHGDQFASRNCAECHDAGEWTEAPVFDHGATSYPLDGQHASLECASCHGEGPLGPRYVPLPHTDCVGCHSEVHGTVMTGACASCHTTFGWHSVPESRLRRGFAHDRTAFPLQGAHALATCGACHLPSSQASAGIRMTYPTGTGHLLYPAPSSETCSACHVDGHGGETVRDDSPCESCHTQDQWAPTTYDLRLHNTESDFELTGAHTVTPCQSCHVTGTDAAGLFDLTLDQRECSACHVQDDPHEDTYGRMACDVCHVTSDFESVEFDHDTPARNGTLGDCAACHQTEDPHADQFSVRSCSDCHTTTTFTVEFFDHTRTRFPLEGAHRAAACAECHTPVPSPAGVPVVRYRPIDPACSECH